MTELKSKYYDEIRTKINLFENKKIMSNTLFIIQIAAIVFLFVLSFIIFLEGYFYFNAIAKTIIVYFLLLVLSIIFIRYIIYPYLVIKEIVGRRDYYNSAERIGNYFPQIKDELKNVFQLISINYEHIYSSQLINASFISIYNRIKDIDFTTVITFEKSRKFLKVTILFFLLFILLFFVPSFQYASYRLIHYQQNFVLPQKFYFIIEPGNKSVTKGDNVTIFLKVTDASVSNINFYYKDETLTNYEIRKLTKDSSGFFKFYFEQINSSILYYAEADGVQSDEFQITVIERPLIKSLSLQIFPPSYTRMSIVEQKDNGNINTIIGSNVKLSIVSSKELKTAYLLYNDSTIQQLKINSNLASLQFAAVKEKSYSIIMEDLNGNKNLSPVNYSIKLFPDEFPSIEIISPNKNVNLSGDERLPIFTKISDDFGFTKLVLNYKLVSSKYETEQKNYQSLEIPISKNLKEAEINYIWNLSTMDLATEDVVSYFLEIYDNDIVSGPKLSKSAVFTVRIPSLDEIFQYADDKQKKVEEDLLKTLKEAEELKKELEKIDQDLKSDKKDINWEEKDKLQKAVDKFEKLQNKVDEINKQLNEAKQELQENNLLKPETLEKYLELQKLFNELSSDEMKKAMEQMQNVLQKMDRKLTQNQLQNMKLDEDTFKKSLERTINLLKRVQVEQKMEEIIKRLDQIELKQNELQQKTEKSDLTNKTERESLQKQQDEISKEMEKLAQEMKDLSDKMKDLQDMPNEDLENSKNEYDKQDNEKLSEEASSEIQKMRKLESQQLQKQISKNMKKMKQNFSSMQQKMQQENQLKTFTEMFRLLNEIINLSKKQEDLKNQTLNDLQSKKNNEITKQQDELKRNLEKILSQLSNLSQKTFAITPEMGKALGDALGDMEKSINDLQNRNNNQASNNQREAMGSLNEAATLMKEMMDAMSQGGMQGGGMMSLMKQLGQLSQQQMSLNNLTQKLQGQGQGNLTPEEQSQLQRLAQQQDLIKKSLEQLNEEARKTGESKKLPSNLQDIVKQMEEVVTSMKTEKLNDELVQKQEKILSKLLDAQKSINERDFEKERKSNTGENVLRNSPGELKTEVSKKHNLKDELNKIFNEGYKKDYEELIRKYYESLQKEITN